MIVVLNPGSFSNILRKSSRVLTRVAFQPGMHSIHPSLLLLGALPAHAHHPREILCERAVRHGRRGGLDGGGDLGGEGAGGPRHGGRGAGHERLKVAANCLLEYAQ